MALQSIDDSLARRSICTGRYCSVEGYLKALSDLGFTMSGCGRANFIGRPQTVNMLPSSAGVSSLARQVSLLHVRLAQH